MFKNSTQFQENCLKGRRHEIFDSFIFLLKREKQFRVKFYENFEKKSTKFNFMYSYLR